MGAGVRDAWPLRGRRSRTSEYRWLLGRNWVAGLAGAGELSAAVWCWVFLVRRWLPTLAEADRSRGNGRQKWGMGAARRCARQPSL